MEKKNRFSILETEKIKTIDVKITGKKYNFKVRIFENDLVRMISNSKFKFMLQKIKSVLRI